MLADDASQQLDNKEIEGVANVMHIVGEKCTKDVGESINNDENDGMQNLIHFGVDKTYQNINGEKPKISTIVATRATKYLDNINIGGLVLTTKLNLPRGSSMRKAQKALEGP